MTAVDFGRGGPWRALWPQALDLMTHLERVTANPPWTLHAAAFLRRLEERAEAAEAAFNLIEARSFRKPFWECIALAHAILDPLTN